MKQNDAVYICNHHAEYIVRYDDSSGADSDISANDEGKEEAGEKEDDPLSECVVPCGTILRWLPRVLSCSTCRAEGVTVIYIFCFIILIPITGNGDFESTNWARFCCIVSLQCSRM